MAHIRLRTPLGTHDVYGWKAETMDRASELALAAARERSVVASFVELQGERAYLKASPLRGATRARHALRSLALRGRIPRVQEYFNLSWLTERLFQTPLPLAAGVLWRAGLPAYQWLLTRELPGVRTLREELESERDAGARLAVLAELAREVARMHALRFVHRDLFPRNLLVGPRESPRRIFFLDAWRGGCRPQLRGPAYDLACLYLRASELMTSEEQRAFLARYASERAALGRPHRGDLARALRRERAGLVRRLERNPELLRGRAPPEPDWKLD